MSRLRRTLVVLLAAATVLFVGGVRAERSAGEPRPAHVEAVESGHGEEAGETEAGKETVLGVDVESTPLVVLAVLAGLGLAVAVATRLGRLRGFLVAVAAIALAWAGLDVREVVHQLDESHTGTALVAMAVAALHLASAAVGGRLAGQVRAG